MEHTKGPWRVGDAGHTVFGPKTDSPSPKIIASNLSRANAKLMAASPRMLEALQGVVCANMIVKSGESDEHSMTMQDAIDAARAAIEAAS